MPGTSSTLSILTAESFKQIAQSDHPAMVDFWAPWCGPCRMLTPILEEIASEQIFKERVNLCKLNGQDYPEVLSQYSILSLPTLVFFSGGIEKDRVVGLQPKNTLVKWLKTCLDQIT